MKMYYEDELKKTKKEELVKLVLELQGKLLSIDNILNPGWSWERSPESMGG